MIKKIYNWTMSLAAHPKSVPALAGVAFVESSFFPIPPDVMIVPMVLAKRERAWRIACVCTIASVLGGGFGYLLGLFFYEEIGLPLLQLYNYAEKFSEFRSIYVEYGAWAVFIAGVTPFPYKVVTILSGVALLDPIIFFTSSIAARGLRFFIIVGLIWKYGHAIRHFTETRLNFIFLICCLLLIFIVWTFTAFI